MTPGGPPSAADASRVVEVPPLLAVDAKGFVWRCYDEHWSMAPSNPDNSPVPEPITYYAPIPAAMPEGLPDMWTPVPEDAEGLDAYQGDYAGRDLFRIYALLNNPALTPEAQLLMARNHAALALNRWDRLVSKRLALEPPDDDESEAP